MTTTNHPHSLEGRNLGDSDKVVALKEKRLATTGKVLTSLKNLNVRFIEAAWGVDGDFDETSRTITLKRGTRSGVADPVEAYLLEKSRFYQQLARVKHTRYANVRQELAENANDPQLYADICTVLEDGRVQGRLREDFPGTGPFLDYLAADWGKHSDVSDIAALAYRARLGQYPNKEARERWGQFEALIQKSLRTKQPKQVWEAALLMANTLVTERQPRQQGNVAFNSQAASHAPQDEDAARDLDGNLNPDSDEDEDPEGDSDEEEDQDEDAGDDEDDEDPQDQPQGPSSGDEAQDAQDDAGEGGSGQGEPEGPQDDEDDQDDDEDAALPPPGGDATTGTRSGGRPEGASADLKQHAFDAVREALERELRQLEELAFESGVKGQTLSPAGYEEDLSAHVGATLHSIRVDRSRVIQTPSRRVGTLSSRRLTNHFTGDSFLVQREKGPGFEFACSVVLDVSGSMGGADHRGSRAYWAGQACRAIFKALEDADVNRQAVLLGSKPVPVEAFPEPREWQDVCYGYGPHELRPGFNAPGGGTDIQGAVRKAGEWLGKQPQARRLMVVLTDGADTVEPHVKERLSEQGVHVVGVGIDMNVQDKHERRMLEQFAHEAIGCDAKDLGEHLERTILNFASA